MGNFWKRLGVLFRTKRMVYKGLVENTLLSGLECETLTAKEMLRLETWNIKHMRKVLGQDNCEMVEGVRRQISNESVREKFGTYTLTSILRKRRLDWLKNIILRVDDNVQLRSAVWGQLRLTRNVEIPWNPWVLQWEKDLDVFAHKCCKVEAHAANKDSGEK